MRKHKKNSNSLDTKKIDMETFKVKLQKLSKVEVEWVINVLEFQSEFSSLLEQFMLNQASMINLADKVNYQRLTELSLQHEERDFSDDELTEDDDEMNYIIGLDKLIYAADKLLEDATNSYKKVLEYQENSKNRQTRNFAKAKKLLTQLTVDPEERQKDILNQLIDKSSELIGQISVYVLMLRQKRAILEALREKPENFNPEDFDAQLTPIQ